MTSFLEEANAANMQRQKQAREAQEKLDGRVETLDEIVETIYKVIKERILQIIHRGHICKEKQEEYHGLFKPMTTTVVECAKVRYMKLLFYDRNYFSVRHEITYDDDDYDYPNDSFFINFGDRSSDQVSTLLERLGRKLDADNIKHDFRWEMVPNEKKERNDKKRSSYYENHAYLRASGYLDCKLYLSEK